MHHLLLQTSQRDIHQLWKSTWFMTAPFVAPSRLTSSSPSNSIITTIARTAVRTCSTCQYSAQHSLKSCIALPVHCHQERSVCTKFPARFNQTHFLQQRTLSLNCSIRNPRGISHTWANVNFLQQRTLSSSCSTTNPRGLFNSWTHFDCQERTLLSAFNAVTQTRAISKAVCKRRFYKTVNRQRFCKTVHQPQFCEVLGVTYNLYLTMATESQTQSKGKAPELSSEDLKMRKLLREIFQTAVDAVMPRSLLEKVIRFNPHLNTLTVENRSYSVQRNIFVVGFGKGVLGLARVVDELLGEHIIKGILSIPTGARDDYKKAGKKDMMLAEGSKICVQEGAANNLPDDSAYRAARDIHKLVSNLTDKDIVIVLMSGGGSALLPYPVEPLDLTDVVTTTQELFSHGATIGDVNTVRRHLEVLKGGGLASAAMPAQVIALIISDVIGDPLDLIASGPTVYQTYSPQQCLEVIDRLNAREAVPPKVLQLLETKKSQLALQSQLTADPRGGMTKHLSSDKMERTHVQNVLVGSNAVGCAAALHCAEQLGFVTCILTNQLAGEARMVGMLLGQLAQYVSACYHSRAGTNSKDLVRLELDIAAQGISKDKLNEIARLAAKAQSSSRPLCVVAGGETIVKLTGSGKGGRNQEMVLAAGLQLQKGFQVYTDRKPQAEVFFLSAGTDGQDGPTDAAGAVVDENFVLDALQEELDPQAFLSNNDSYTLWSQFAGARDHIVTGLTGTNVMDIHLLVVTSGRRT